MNDDFEKKVRAAAIAGWWTILVGYVLLTIMWLVYLVIVSTQPAWIIGLWGRDIRWDFMQTVSLWLMGILKLILWTMIFVALWLTLWARQLRKQNLPENDK